MLEFYMFGSELTDYSSQLHKMSTGTEIQALSAMTIQQIGLAENLGDTFTLTQEAAFYQLRPSAHPVQHCFLRYLAEAFQDLRRGLLPALPWEARDLT